ncbi:MAG: GGDEF domain-containing protein [Actinobacteria bacterium]|nr:GGDEF domain-containing protein [Actinomycetota bacterium]
MSVTLPTATTAVERLDSQRRIAVRNRLLEVGAIVGVAGGAVLALSPTAPTVGVVAIACGVGAAVVRLLTRRSPGWASLAAIAVLVAAVLLVPVVHTGALGGSAFFVGVFTLVVMASAPRTVAWIAVAGAGVMLMALAAITAFGRFPEAIDGDEITWWRVAFEGVLVLVLSLVGVFVQLRLVAAAEDDLVRERTRVEALSIQLAEQNAALELDVEQQEANLATAVRDRDQMAADLREASNVDPGSGLPNQRRWESQLPVMLTHARTQGRPVCIAVVDLDEFSKVNNELGHPTGSEVIRRVAQRLARSSAPGTFVSRIGGEEFALAMPAVDERTALDQLTLLQAAVASEPWAEIDVHLNPTFSAGVCEVSPDAFGDVSSVAREALHRADLAMQRAKRNGRNRVVAAESL